jgi:hypothetical protein
LASHLPRNTPNFSDLFSCRNLSDAHYQYLKPPGESVTLACPKNCSSGETRWYHSYVKKTATAAAGGGLDLLAWSGSSHEAAVGETPSQGSVGYFCCACEEEEDPARDGCCWGVGYQPVVNMTITASQGWTHEDETIAVPGARLSLSCEARGYPNISISISPPPSGANNSLSVAHQCQEIVRSWYSTVVVCNWTTDTQQTGRFTCNGTIWLDSADNKIVPYLETASQQLSICNVPSLVRLYQASSLEGPQLDLKCEIDCCRVSTCSVSWYFEGEEIDTRDSRFRISTEDEGLVHVLSVANPGVRDLGRYFCVLRSPLRDAPDKETVTITYPGVYWVMDVKQNLVRLSSICWWWGPYLDRKPASQFIPTTRIHSTTRIYSL